MSNFAWWDVVAYACPRCAERIRKAYPAAVGDEMVLSVEQAEETETECDFCGSIAELFPIADINE